MNNYLEWTTHNISWFIDKYHEDAITLRPSFQRNPVWTEKQKSYLIDSILRGFPIPELYLQEKISDKGETEIIVVDGQQRLTSIIDFLEQRFKLVSQDFETDEKWIGYTFDDLSSEDKRNFYGYKFVIRILPETSDDELRHIFKRINKNNVALNNQELRQSTYSGTFIQTINKIADKPYWEETGLFTPVKVRRMLDAETISEISIAYLNGHQNKKDNLEKYYVAYEEFFDQEDELEDVFDNVVKELLKILPDFRKTRWHKITDFYTLFLVMAQYNEQLPFSADERKKLENALNDFGEKVSDLQSAMKQEDFSKAEYASTELSKYVYDYSAGIRASTDLGSRKLRFNALDGFIKTII